MKRILIGVTYYLPNISGVSVYAQILAEELARRGKEVEILTSNFKDGLENNEKIGGVKICRVKGRRIGKGILMGKYPSVSFKKVKECDVINCHLPSLESFWLALWAKIFRKKLIVTHHCEFGFSGTIGNRAIAGLSFLPHFFTYLMADKIISYTKDYAINSMYLKIFRKKITYILPPIKLEEGKKNFDFGKGKVVAYVGRIAWEKGLTYLIEAMKNVPGKLVLAGPYKEVVGDKTYEKIKERLGKNIVLTGPIEHKNLKNFYKKIDCLVLPSTNNLETFGIVQAEAMKCGTPVVASNLPGVRVPVRMMGMGEVCEIKNANDLAKKINIVLNNGKKYYQKRSKKLEFFDFKKTVMEYEKIF